MVDTCCNSVFKDKVWTLWTLSVKNQRAAPFGDVHSIEPAEGTFSPDGRWVAYRSRETEETTTGDVFLQPFPATGEKHLVRKGSHVYWSPRGDALVVNAGAGHSVVIPVTTTPLVTFGQERDLPRGLRREGPRPTRREVDSMPDGEHFIGVLPRGSESLLPQINIVLNWFDEVRQRVPK